MADLITRIGRTYQLILDNRSSSQINAMENVLADIAQVIQECAQFVTKYAETTSFCRFITSVFVVEI